MPSKTFILDTNVLIENEKSVEILRNGKDDTDINNIVICAEVINELDGLKRDNVKRPKVIEVIKHLIEYKDNYKIQGNIVGLDTVDNRIIKEALEQNSIVVTNDIMMHLKCAIVGVQCEEFKESNPFKSESQIYTGFIEKYDENGNLTDLSEYENCFYWDEGKMIYWSNGKKKTIDYENDIWKLKPKTVYQNAAFELLLDNKIDLVTIQSEAGFGKTYIALAAALYQLLQEKSHKKIYIIKPNIEIGQELGFLPGDVDEKMFPYFRPIRDLILKLHELRPANKLFLDAEGNNLSFNPKFLEMLPINHMRGMNISDAIVIVDEIQNLSREETRSVLSRMGDNVKCICTGDTRQIDNKHCNEQNNGLNWIVKLCKGQKNYGHIVLKGLKSRGPIADLIRNVSL